jgi:hypothetical protein
MSSFIFSNFNCQFGTEERDVTQAACSHMYASGLLYLTIQTHAMLAES